MDDNQFKATEEKLIARLSEEEKQFIVENGEMPAIKLSDAEMEVVRGGKEIWARGWLSCTLSSNSTWDDGKCVAKTSQ